MKRILAVLLLIALVFPIAYADADEADTAIEYDFKQFMWGDSKEAVIAVEGEPIATDMLDNGLNVTCIAYTTKAVGLDVLLFYYFCDDGLYQVGYALQEDHTNHSLYIDDYNTFRTALTKKYGEPVTNYEKWNNDLMKGLYDSDDSDKGTALYLGYLTYVTMYTTERTTIIMRMSADNFEISTIIGYESTEISPGEADFSDDI